MKKLRDWTVKIWMRKVWLDDAKTVLILTEKLNMLLKLIIQLTMNLKSRMARLCTIL